MTTKKEFSIQELLRASKMNLEDKKSMNEIAREFGVSVNTLKARMNEHNIDFRLHSTKKRSNKIYDESIFISQIDAKRKEYKEGQKVCITNNKNPEYNNGSYYLSGVAVIKNIHKNFMVVETEKALRESISFISIIKNEIKVV